MYGFTGTWRLARLALRRDRVKLPVWIVALTAMLASNVPAVASFYGKNMTEQVTYAANMAPSLVGRIFNGPIDGPDIGTIVVNETLLFMAIAIAFMSALTVVRHTRQNEETGRAELIGSAVVGRNAGLGAALLVAVGANAVLTVLLFFALAANGLEVWGSLGMAACLGLVGMVFAGVAAVTAQIAESARGANSLAAVVVGVAFLLRAAGDGVGHLTANKLGVISAWPSWLSPLGWAQQVYPYTKGNWWVLGLLLALFAATIAAAFYYNSHRDLGSGLVQTRKGPARAPRVLLSPLGLAHRLQRGVWRGWAATLAVMGCTIGLVSKEFATMYKENPQIKDYLAQLGGAGRFDDVFFGAMLALMSIAVAGYAVQALQRMRSEEANGQLEVILAAAVSKPRWLWSHITYTFVGSLALLAILGACAGATYVAVTDAPVSAMWRLTGGALAQAPAVLAVAGFAVAAFGLLSRAVIAVAWSAFGAVLFIGQFGALLKLPRFVMNVSPFTHLPPVPAEPPEYAPMAILFGAALLLALLGTFAFRRRDITTG